MKIITLFIFIFLNITINAQKKWQPFAGILLSVNADAFYVGPSFTGGVNHFLDKKKKWSVSPEIHFFEKNKKDVISSSMYEEAHFISWSVRSNINYYTAKKGGQGFFLGLGLGFQSAFDRCYTYINGEIDKDPNAHFYKLKYKKIMPSINFGYAIPSKYKTQWQFILTGIGPYTERTENTSYTEILSVLSVGTRLLF